MSSFGPRSRRGARLNELLPDRLCPRREKQLRAIRDARVATPIRRAIEKLADNPRPPGCLKLVGEVDQWRVRVGIGGWSM